MKLGILGGRGDRRGLAAQTAEMAKHLGADRVLGFDVGGLSPYPADWCEFDRDRLTVVPLDSFDVPMLRTWAQGLDVVLGAETFYRPWVVAELRSMGVATVLHYNHEFVWTQKQWGYADVMVAPTSWHLDETPGAVCLPLGVDRTRFPFRQRTEATTFLHVVGHHAAHDRNGTRTVFDAMRYVQRRCTVIIRSQRGLPIPRRIPGHVRLRVEVDDILDRADLYAAGDVMLLPRRYGGQALAAQEALSTGMPVLMSDCAPQDTWLPAGMLVHARADRTFSAQGGELPLYDVNPQRLAERMDALIDNPTEVAQLSAAAGEAAEAFAWPALVPRWQALLAGATPAQRAPSGAPWLRT